MQADVCSSHTLVQGPKVKSYADILSFRVTTGGMTVVLLRSVGKGDPSELSA